MKLNMWTILDWFERHGYAPHGTLTEDGELISSFFLGPSDLQKDETAVLSFKDGSSFICGTKDFITLPGCSLPLAVQEFSAMQLFYNDWEHSCLVSLIDIRNPQSLVELSSEVFSRPICFKNNEELVFGQTPDFETKARQFAVEPDKAKENGLSFQAISSAREPIVYYSRFYRCTVAQSNIWKKSENIASIIILEAGQPFTRGDLCLMDRFAAFMHTLLEHDRSDLFSGKGVASLLVDLVRGKPVSVENLQSLYNVTRWSVNDMFILLCFRDIFDGETPLKRALRSSLKTRFPNCQLMFYEDVIGIINVTKTGSYENIMQTIRSILPPDSPPLGASFPFKGLERMNIYYHQAQLAIQYAQQNELPFADTYNIALSYMTNLTSCDLLGSHMLHPDVLHLLSIDQTEGTDYASTLFCWLMSGGNYTDAAQKLKIHRNTVIYRMNYIAEISSTDLLDFENQKLLLFSCLVLEPGFRSKSHHNENKNRVFAGNGPRDAGNEDSQ